MKVCLIVFLCIFSAYPNSHRFKDFITGESVSGLDHIWNELHSFYKIDFPKSISIKYHNSEFSGYEYPNIIWLGNRSSDPSTWDKRFYELVRHELSHLGNMHLTKKLSKLNEFRFIDEGLAGLFESTTYKKWFKDKSLKIADEYIKANKASIKIMQDWKVFFGDYTVGNLDWNSYKIGSSFIYYLIDSYGHEKLRDFLLAIGELGTLENALLKIYSLKVSEAERKWVNYVAENTKTL